MEGDVVFAHEVVGQGVGVVPPVPPAVGVTEASSPFDGGRKIADHRVEPDVEPLSRLLAPTIQRNGDAPVDVTAHRPGLDLVQDVLTELDDVGSPESGGCTIIEPLAERLGQRGQIKEEVLGLDEFGGFPVDLAARIDQVGGVELIAAVVTLVPARLGIPTDVAGAFDIAVRQGAAGRGADRGRGGLLHHVAVVVDGGEHLLHHGVVVGRGRAGEQVVGHAEIDQVSRDHSVVDVG